MTLASPAPARAPFDLCLSENPFPPLPSVLIALNQVMAQANRYPEFLPRRLPQLIAGQVGADTSQVIVGQGATGVALQIMQAVLQPGDSMVFAAPTFDGYPIMADIVGVRQITVGLDPHGQQDLHALAAAVGPGTGLVVLCRPHNPTGTVVEAAALQEFLQQIPPQTVVLLDEAYIEFVAPADLVDTAALLARHPNLLVLRTFSKAFGLAGLRIGYALGNTLLAARVRRLDLPFGMNAAAVPAVAASYAAERELRARVRHITTERERLRNSLRQYGFTVPESHANFLYVPGPRVAQRLIQAGISAKAYPDGSARIAVGDPAASAAVLEALTQSAA